MGDWGGVDITAGDVLKQLAQASKRRRPKSVTHTILWTSRPVRLFKMAWHTRTIEQIYSFPSTN